MRRALFKCNGCEMELHLLAPVDRPCPNCGGIFIEIDERDIDLGYRPSHTIFDQEEEEITEWKLDRMVKKALPDMFEEIDRITAEAAKDV